ncbi:MAG: DUF47 family protein [Coriobacteriales bacterium]|nr:DUF47 family protein [Coriobacteriales bacterium]
MSKTRFDYFNGFERIAEYASEEARLLERVLNDFEQGRLKEFVDQIHEIENRADKVNHEVFERLAAEFVTPIDREDIISMTHALDDIVDAIEGVVQRLYMFNVTSIPPAAKRMAELILKSTDALSTALKDFPNFKKSKTLNRLLVAVSDNEEEADEIYLETMRELFTGSDDPIHVLAWNSIYGRMEQCCDDCEHAANLMDAIIMKNS